MGKDEEELVNEVGGEQCGYLGGVVGGRHFYDVEGDQVYTAKAANEFDDLAARHAGHFRCASSRRESGIDTVDIERHIDRVANYFLNPSHRRFDPLTGELIAGDDVEASRADFV